MVRIKESLGDFAETNHVTARERSLSLLAIDPRIEQRREQLKKEQADLFKAQMWLQGLNSEDQGHEADVTMHGT